jgi:hypothetical protein
MAKVGDVDRTARDAQQALTKASMTTAAVAVKGSVGAALGLGTAGGATAASTGAAGALSGTLTSAGISVSVPVAGWIIAGAALLAVGVIAIVRAARKKGRKEMERVAARYGNKGKLFARTYVRSSKRSAKKNTARLNRLTKELANLKNRKATNYRRNRGARILEEMQGTAIVLATQIQPAERKKPQVANEPATVPEVADLSDQDVYMYVGLAAGLVGLLMLAPTPKRS